MKDFSTYFRDMTKEGYAFENGQTVPTTAKKVNYAQLRDILLSNDENLLEQHKWIFDGENYFLDGKENLRGPQIGNHIQFTSFPRSGNSMLRKLIENVTGVETGSTMPAIFNSVLPIIGMKGESYFDNSVWVVKTHYPTIMPTDEQNPFRANKTFMVVRNPYDVIPSYSMLLQTGSHSAQVDYDYLQDYPEWWHNWVKNTVRKMKWFFDTIIQEFVNDKKNPIYIVRYEDLVHNERDTLMGLFSFILGQKDLTGTNVERRINKVAGMGLAGSKTYELKSTTSKIGYHIRDYPPELRQYLDTQLKNFAYRFGYANVGDNPTGLMKYAEHTQDSLDTFEAYKKVNEASLDWVCKPDFAETSKTIAYLPSEITQELVSEYEYEQMALP